MGPEDGGNCFVFCWFAADDVRRCLSTLPLGVIGRLCSSIVPFLGHLRHFLSQHKTKPTVRL